MRSKSKRRQERQQLLAAFLCAVIVIALLFSSVYIVRQAGHSCSEKSCSICGCLQLCESILRRIMDGASLLILFAIVALFGAVVSTVPIGICSFTTLIEQNIRLNN